SVFGDGGDELPEGGGGVVDDVVGAAGFAVVQRGHRGGGGVLVVDEGDLASVADHRQHPSAEQAYHVVDVGAVEQPVPQRDALDALGLGGLLLGGDHRRQVWVERVPL